MMTLDFNRHWIRKHVNLKEILCICDKNRNLISCPNYSTGQELRYNIKTSVAIGTDWKSMSVLQFCTGLLITISKTHIL